MVQRLEQLFLFPGQWLAAPPGPPNVEGLERWTVDSSEGAIEAWFLPPFERRLGEVAPAVIFAHGNGELIDQWVGTLDPYRKMGLGLLLPEYRGYGRSKGTPSESAIADDFARFFDRLADRRDVDAAKIVLHGRSLGGGAVCALAKRRAAAGIVLESTFTSVAAVARRWLVPAAVISNRFDNESLVREFPHPILVLHGRRDGVIPHAHGVALAGLAKQAKLVSYDCDHNDIVRSAQGYWSEIAAYLVTLGILPFG